MTAEVNEEGLELVNNGITINRFICLLSATVDIVCRVRVVGLLPPPGEGMLACGNVSAREARGAAAPLPDADPVNYLIRYLQIVILVNIIVKVYTVVMTGTSSR